MVRQGDVDGLYSANFSGAVFAFGEFPYTFIARGRKIAQLVGTLSCNLHRDANGLHLRQTIGEYTPISPHTSEHMRLCHRQPLPCLHVDVL